MATATILRDTPSLNEIQGRTHRTRYWQKVQLQKRWAIELRAAFPRMTRATGKRRLRIERHCARLYDRDNFIGGLKAIIDTMTARRKGFGWFVDDHPKWLELEAVQVPHKRKDLPDGNYTVVTITKETP